MHVPDVLKNIDNLDDLIDHLLDPIKDYTDTIEDLVKPIQGLLSIYNLRKKIQLKSFIKGYSGALQENQITKTDKIKLVKYFKSEKNILLVSEILESAVSSLSVKSSSVLGVLAGKTLLNKSDSLSNIDYVLIGSLKNMTDTDLDLFVHLIKFIDNNNPPSRETENGELEYRFRDIYKDMDSGIIPFERIQIESLIERLKNLGVLSYGAGGIGSYGNERGAFMQSEYSRALFKLLLTTLQA